MSVVLEPQPEGLALRKVLMSEELFLKLGVDRVEWGEPDADGFYTPTLARVEHCAELLEAGFGHPLRCFGDAGHSGAHVW